MTFTKSVVLIMLLAFSLRADMAQVHSILDTKNLLETLDSSSLVVFDVDRVLIEYEDAILHGHNNQLLRNLVAKHAQECGLQDPHEYFTTIHLQARPRLIEKEVVELIRSLQQKNIPVIALTATGIGSIPKIGSIQDWRIARLKELGLTFSFQEHPPHSLHELTGQGPSPVFKEGILFSATYSKGAVLKSFLQNINWTPRTVVFFDDFYVNVLTVHNEMGELGVDNVHSFHYLGAEKWLHSLDLPLAEAQIRHLLEHAEWLNEERCKTHCHTS